MNVVVLRGRLRSAPSVRQLSSGVVVASFELIASADVGQQTVVPVTMSVHSDTDLLNADDEVVVIGQVRRRFFRVGGVTQSRTEVDAAELIPAANRRRVRSALLRCAERLGAGQTGAVRSR